MPISVAYGTIRIERVACLCLIIDRLCMKHTLNGIGGWHTFKVKWVDGGPWELSFKGPRLAVWMLLFPQIKTLLKDRSLSFERIIGRSLAVELPLRYLQLAAHRRVERGTDRENDALGDPTLTSCFMTTASYPSI